MKKQQFNQLLIAIFIAILTVAFFFNKATFKLNVKRSVIEMYEDYLSEQDSSMQSKNYISQRRTYKELKVDSMYNQIDSAELRLFIVRPYMIGDSLVKGQLHEIYYKKIKRIFF